MARLRRFTTLGILTCGVIISSVLPASRAAAFQSEETPTDAAIRTVLKAFSPQRDGSDLRLLFALRQLHDPQLKPLFEQLLANGAWQLQVHAALGLAEMREPRRVQPEFIRTISPEAQESVLATALDLELLPKDSMIEIATWEGLQPMARLFLIAELVTLKEAVDQEELLTLSKAEDDHIGGLSACLLAELGNAESLKAFRTRLANAATNARNEVILWLLEAVRRYRLLACAEWVRAVIAEPNAEPDIIYRGVFTLLEIDPASGLSQWERVLGDKPTYQVRIRYGLLLLATKNKTASAYQRLKGQEDEPVINGIIAMGNALVDGGDQSNALIGLLDLNHLKSTDWAMTHIAKIPKDQAAIVYAHLIDRVSTSKANPDDVVSLAIQGTSKLFDIDPDAALQRLSNAADDSLLQQAILLGLFETPSPKPGEAAAKLRRIGSGKADSLALLLMAKHASTLTQEDKDQLGKVAAGGGRLSDILEVQAAWLYLKHTGQTDKVKISDMKAENGKPKAETATP